MASFDIDILKIFFSTCFGTDPNILKENVSDDPCLTPWALCPPQEKSDWHFFIEDEKDEKNKKFIAFYLGGVSQLGKKILQKLREIGIDFLLCYDDDLNYMTLKINNDTSFVMFCFYFTNPIKRTKPKKC